MQTTVTLDTATERRLDRLAEASGEDRETLIRRLLEQALEDAEDYAEASAVLSRVRAGKETVISAGEMWRGMDD